MRNVVIFFFVLLLAVAIAFLIFKLTSEEPYPIELVLEGEGDLKEMLPVGNGSGQLLVNSGFVLSYNEEHEQANWVAYELKREEIGGDIERPDDFREDHRVHKESASLADYKGSGFDRGHLAPAADFKWSKEAVSETFYLTNISPQKPGFNRGIWRELEHKVRDWAFANKKIYVVSGGILSTGLKKIGRNGVSVPRYYFKALLDNTQPQLKCIAFLLKNDISEEPLSAFVVPVDSLEKLTGLDFFPGLENSLEAKLERQADYFQWERSAYR